MSAQVRRLIHSIANPMLKPALSAISFAVACALAHPDAELNGSFESISRQPGRATFPAASGSATNPLFYQRFIAYFALGIIGISSSAFLNVINRYLFNGDETSKKTITHSALLLCMQLALNWFCIGVPPDTFLNTQMTRAVILPSLTAAGILQTIYHYLGQTTAAFSWKRQAYPASNNLLLSLVGFASLYSLQTSSAWSGALNLETINTPTDTFIIKQQNFLPDFLETLTKISIWPFLFSAAAHLVSRSRDNRLQTPLFRLMREWFLVSALSFISARIADSDFTEMLNCNVGTPSSSAPNQFSFPLTCPQPPTDRNMISSWAITALMASTAYHFLRDRQTWSSPASFPPLIGVLNSTLTLGMLASAVGVLLNLSLATTLSIAIPVAAITFLVYSRVCLATCLNLFESGVNPYLSIGQQAALSATAWGMMSSLWIDTNFSMPTLHAVSILPTLTVGIFAHSAINHEIGTQLQRLKNLIASTRMAMPLTTAAYLLTKLSNTLNSDPHIFSTGALSSIRLFRALSIPIMIGFSFWAHAEQSKREEDYEDRQPPRHYTGISAAPAAPLGAETKATESKTSSVRDVESAETRANEEANEHNRHENRDFLKRHTWQAKDSAFLAIAATATTTLVLIQQMALKNIAGHFSFETQGSGFGTADFSSHQKHAALWIASLSIASCALISFSARAVCRFRKDQAHTATNSVKSSLCCRMVRGECKRPLSHPTVYTP